MKNNIDLIIEPLSEDYDANDERWLNQVNDLINECQRDVGEVTKKITPQEGKKGGFEEIMLVLGSSGAIQMAFEVFKAWILRDKTRTIKVKIKVGDKVKELEMSGTGFKKEEMETYMKLALSLQTEKDE